MPDHGARVLWQACQAKIIYAGTSEPELCQLIEDLCGYVKVRGPDEHHYTHRGELRRRPASTEIRVLPMAAIRQLPPGRAVVLQGTAPPVIVRTEQYWRRADYRAWHRTGHPPDLPEPARHAPTRQAPARAARAGRAPGGPTGWPHLSGDQRTDRPHLPRSAGRASSVPGAASRAPDTASRTRPDRAPRPQRPARPAPWDQAAPRTGADEQP